MNPLITQASDLMELLLIMFNKNLGQSDEEIFVWEGKPGIVLVVAIHWKRDFHEREIRPGHDVKLMLNVCESIYI